MSTLTTKTENTLQRIHALEHAVSKVTTRETAVDDKIAAFEAGYNFHKERNPEKKVYCISSYLNSKTLNKALNDIDEFKRIAIETQLVYTLNEFEKAFNNEGINPNWYMKILS
jgi:hypothetical protein